MSDPVIAKTAESMLGLTHEVVAEDLGLSPDEIHNDRDLEAHGADSIDRVEILISLKQRLGLELPLAQFAAIADLQSLAVFLDDQMRGTTK